MISHSLRIRILVPVGNFVPFPSLRLQTQRGTESSRTSHPSSAFLRRSIQSSSVNQSRSTNGLKLIMITNSAPSPPLLDTLPASQRPSQSVPRATHQRSAAEHQVHGAITFCCLLACLPATEETDNLLPSTFLLKCKYVIILFLCNVIHNRSVSHYY